MKTLYILLVTLFVFTSSNAQFGEQQVISIEAANARSVYAADIDGDGDLDVLSASEGDDKVAWYENLNGLGDFGPQQIITQNLNAAVDVYAADIDGDGDMDLLVASKGHSPSDGRVVWFENLDGLGDFGPQQIISLLTEGPLSVYASDLDGDGDLDALSASFVDNKIAWYENTDGLGDFGSQQIISINALSTRDVYAADLDGDGDIDVLAASTGEAKVIWFENTDGMGTFGVKQVIMNNAISVLSVYAEDIDGDGDYDVLSASPVDNKVAWYENMDGLGNFGLQNIITTNLEGERLVFATDLDNDGDIDVLSAYQESLGGEIVWYENIDGLGNFGLEQIITDEAAAPRSVFAADLDGDGYKDVISASTADWKIAWYKNITYLGLDDNLLQNITLTPNPTTGIIKIESDLTINLLKVYDALGRQILIQYNPSNHIDISNLSNGLFIVQLETDSGVLTKKILKE